MDMGRNESQVKLEVPFTYFHDQQLDKWSRLNQGIHSAVEYIKMLDEFMARCGEFVAEPPMTTLSRFIDLAFVMTRVENSLHEMFVVMSTPTK